MRLVCSHSIRRLESSLGERERIERRAAELQRAAYHLRAGSGAAQASELARNRLDIAPMD